MIRNPEQLVGKRFTADLRVAHVTPGDPDDEDRPVLIYMYGEANTISLGELSSLIESGFIMEVPEGR